MNDKDLNGETIMDSLALIINRDDSEASQQAYFERYGHRGFMPSQIEHLYDFLFTAGAREGKKPSWFNLLAHRREGWTFVDPMVQLRN